MEVVKLDAGFLAVKFLGIALVTLIVGIVLCFLASLGYNTYMKFTKKEIEVHTENSNSPKNDLYE
jgi:hypothetical protein